MTESNNASGECAPWGKNRGRYLTIPEIHKLVYDLMFVDTIHGNIQSRARNVAGMVVDFTNTTNPSDPDGKQMLIMRKGDWEFIDSLGGNPIGEVEPCAPTGYQGADIDAGYDDEETY